MTTYAQVCRNGHIVNTCPNPEYIESDNYCKDCGSECIIHCPECNDQKIIASEDNIQTSDVTRSDLDLFCRNCGEGFPWTGENGMVIRRGIFVGTDYVEDPLNEQTIEEINRCYRIGANSAVLVLYRKLIENLIIDILRSHYGTDSIEKFYNDDRRQFHRFSKLISNFNNSLPDLDHYSDNLDGELIENIEEFKENGDAMAHSIRYDLTDEELEELSDDASYIARSLFYLKNEVQRATDT